MRKWMKRILLVCLIAIAGLAAYYGYGLYHFSAASLSVASVGPAAQAAADAPGASAVPKDLDGEFDDEADVPEWDGKDVINILLLGADSRDEEAGRSDSIMVASINPVTRKAYLMTVLRDTYAEIPGHGSTRINAAFAYGGTDLAMKTVGDLLGIPIHYYVYTDFNGFISLVDAIGGIDLYVEKDMRYSDGGDNHRYDIDLKQGEQHLDGTTALEYVRFRHDATSDFTRTERQRKFLVAVAAKIQSSSSILKLPGILNSIAPYIKTNFSAQELIKLARLGFGISADQIDKAQIPPNGLWTNATVGGAQVLKSDPAKLQQYVSGLLNGDGLSAEEANEANQEAGQR